MALSPSQRINLLKEIAQNLAVEDWKFIDLTLETFKFPTEEMWNGDSQGYVLAMAKTGGDSDLISLATHLGIPVGTVEAPTVSSAPPKTGRLLLFVSHLADHKDEAGRLSAALLRHGIDGFVAHDHITPTAEWEKEIERALLTCEALVVLLHPKFHESKWTDQEIGYAMGRQVGLHPVPKTPS